MSHELKTWPAYFEAIWDGRKTFEVRRDDRGFQAGDEVLLREYDAHAQAGPFPQGIDDGWRYSGRQVHATIGYVLHGVPTTHLGLGRDGFNFGEFVVFSLVEVERIEPGSAPDTSSASDTRPATERDADG